MTKPRPYLVLDAEQAHGVLAYASGLKALMNIIYRQPGLRSLLVVSSMHINKPFPRLTHSSLSQHARVIRDDGRTTRMSSTSVFRPCAPSLCNFDTRLRGTAQGNGESAYLNSPAPPSARPVGEMGKVKGRERKRGRGGKGGSRGWFGLSFGALPTRRASNVNGGRREGRTDA